VQLVTEGILGIEVKSSLQKRLLIALIGSFGVSREVALWQNDGLLVAGFDGTRRYLPRYSRSSVIFFASGLSGSSEGGQTHIVTAKEQ
jgi:hypothetical protein